MHQIHRPIAGFKGPTSRRIERLFGPGNGSTMAMYVVLVLVRVVVIRFSIPIKLSTDRNETFTHINEKILRQAKVADFLDPN